jgi:hypothetical protein
MRSFLVVVVVAATVPAFAMKNLRRSFPDTCDELWNAAMHVAKTQDYRIVTVDHEDKIISLVAGGVWGGERLMTLSLEPGEEGGCVATVQSRFSGVLHSDGPDLLARVSIEVLKATVDPDSLAFRHFKKCMEWYGFSTTECEDRLQKEIAKQSKKTSKPKEKPPASAQDPGERDWWNVDKKQTAQQTPQK